jgi:hypothetical protein
MQVSSLMLVCFKMAKFYNYLLNVSIVTRWIIFIVPVLGLLWIPGILSLTTYPKANVGVTVLFKSGQTNFVVRSGMLDYCGGVYGYPSAGEVGLVLLRMCSMHNPCLSTGWWTALAVS